jgi:hypothetical protein
MAIPIASILFAVPLRSLTIWVNCLTTVSGSASAVRRSPITPSLLTVAARSFEPDSSIPIKFDSDLGGIVTQKPSYNLLKMQN